jgi:transposase
MSIKITTASNGTFTTYIASPSAILIWQRLYNEGGITAQDPKPRGRPSMPKRHEIQALLAKPSSEITPD